MACCQAASHYLTNDILIYWHMFVLLSPDELTHWSRVTHICLSKLTIIGSDNGLATGRRQAIMWTNAGILLIQTLGTNISKILSKIHTFSFTEMHLKMSSGKWQPFCLSLNVLTSSKSDLGLISVVSVPNEIPIYTVLCHSMSQCIMHQYRSYLKVDLIHMHTNRITSLCKCNLRF